MSTPEAMGFPPLAAAFPGIDQLGGPDENLAMMLAAFAGQ